MKVLIPRWSATMIVVVCVSNCWTGERSRDVGQAIRLPERCVRLKRAAYILETAGGVPYLWDFESNVDKTVAQVPAGSVIAIQGIRMSPTFEMTTLTVMGRPDVLKAEIDISRVFSLTWIVAAAQALKWEDPKAEVLRQPRLNSELAEWCGQQLSTTP